MPKTCTYCYGTGKQEVWKNINCSKCYGTGKEFKKVLDDFELPFDCSSCSGSGKLFSNVKETCSSCRGSGYTDEPNNPFDFQR
mgnify:CR=1 FL=1